jgi:hypothetical protein
MQWKAPVGAGAGEARGRLDAVQAGQCAVFPAAAASQGIIVGIAHLAGTGAQYVASQCHDHIGPGEVVDGVDRLAEGGDGRGLGMVVGDA